VLLLAAAAYVDSLTYEFVWDDATMVLQNLGIRDPRNLRQLLRSDFTTLTSGAMEGHYYRPAMALSLAVDFFLWGPHPAPFHLTNVLLHVGVTGLVGCLTMAMGASRGLALLTTLLFAIHPVHGEAVAFVSARSDLLPTLGMLASILAYRRAVLPRPRRGPWWLLCLACQVLALLAKETAVTLPVLLVLSDRLGLSTSHPSDGRIPWRRALVRSLPFWGVTAIFVAVRIGTLAHLAGPLLQGGGLWGRLPGSLEILGRYVWLSLVPTHMQPFYSLPRPQSFLDPGPSLGLLAGGLLVLLLAVSWRRAPLAAFGGTWFLITVIPSLDLVPVSFREMGLADRYLYLPSVGISLLLAQGIVLLMGPATQRGWRPRRLLGWVMIAILLSLYSWQLLRYAPVWRDNQTLYARMVEVAPRSPTPSLNLGLAYYRAGDLPRATAALERAVRLNPRLQRPRAILALLYVLQGRAAEGFRLLEALAAEGTGDRDYYVARSTAHSFVGDVREALGFAEEGVRRFPEDAHLTELHGRALERVGRPAEAAEQYHRALRLSPDLFHVEEALGDLLARSGRPAEAAEHFLRSAEIRPDRPQPLRALAFLSEAQGNRLGALGLWRQVLHLAPNGVAIQEAAQHIRRLEREGNGTLSPSATHRTEQTGS
jgi:tetratricopeptide (TPR) repeat protein